MGGTVPGPGTLGELAHRLRRLAREEVVNAGTHVARFQVRQASPLVIEEMDGDLVLEEGDPDFTIGDLLRHFRASNGLQVNDQVLVVHAGGEWHATDVVTDRTAWEP